MRLYADVNFRRAIVRGLRERGLDIITAQDDHTDRLSDTALLTHITQLERAILTHDKDFLLIGQLWQEAGIYFYGIIYVADGCPIGQCIEEIELLAFAELPESLIGHIRFIPM